MSPAPAPKPAAAPREGQRVVCVMKRGDGTYRHFDGAFVAAQGARWLVRFDGEASTYAPLARDCQVIGRTGSGRARR